MKTGTVAVKFGLPRKAVQSNRPSGERGCAERGGYFERGLRASVGMLRVGTFVGGWRLCVKN